jgi:hypothetical protein
MPFGSSDGISDLNRDGEDNAPDDEQRDDRGDYGSGERGRETDEKTNRREEVHQVSDALGLIRERANMFSFGQDRIGFRGRHAPSLPVQPDDSASSLRCRRSLPRFLR